ncbi:MAG TPA: GNAT family protein [candidate division Zixibacteria bacterium]|nr:GNAT family protein [candidate division Zixibacteria bacterium]
MSNEDKLTAAPSLIGAKVYLRPATPTDLENMWLWRALSEPQSMSSHPLILRTAAEFMEGFKARNITDAEQRFAICRKKDKMPVGIVRFFGFNSLNRSAELGLIVDPDERKNGYGSEAIMILTDYLFDYRGLYKVHAQTAAFNKGTVALLESLGFHRDGILRSHYFFNKEFHDGYIYSLLLSDREW